MWREKKKVRIETPPLQHTTRLLLRGCFRATTSCVGTCLGAIVTAVIWVAFVWGGGGGGTFLDKSARDEPLGRCDAAQPARPLPLFLPSFLPLTHL